jgi:outer membrane immunogenic protein
LLGELQKVMSDLRRRLRGARFVVSVFLGLVGLVSPAMAQTVRPSGWTGFYAGLSLGGEFFTGGSSSFCTAPNGTPFGPGCVYPNNLRADKAGIAGGVLGGYLYQIGHTVLGIEADLSALSAQGTTTLQSPGYANGVAPVPNIQTVTQQVDWLATLRPRVGYDFGGVLAYATGGLALGQTRIDGKVGFPGTSFGYPSSGQATMLGYAVGGGVEYALFERWTVRAEGLYFDLGSQNIWNTGGRPANGAGFTAGFTGYFNGALARVAATYRF